MKTNTTLYSLHTIRFLDKEFYYLETYTQFNKAHNTLNNRPTRLAAY
jgi:hypothetical protein